jgi:hypothetical protein
LHSSPNALDDSALPLLSLLLRAQFIPWTSKKESAGGGSTTSAVAIALAAAELALLAAAAGEISIITESLRSGEKTRSRSREQKGEADANDSGEESSS